MADAGTYSGGIPLRTSPTCPNHVEILRRLEADERSISEVHKRIDDEVEKRADGFAELQRELYTVGKQIVFDVVKWVAGIVGSALAVAVIGFVAHLIWSAHK